MDIAADDDKGMKVMMVMMRRRGRGGGGELLPGRGPGGEQQAVMGGCCPGGRAMLGTGDALFSPCVDGTHTAQPDSIWYHPSATRKDLPPAPHTPLPQRRETKSEGRGGPLRPRLRWSTTTTAVMKMVTPLPRWWYHGESWIRGVGFSPHLPLLLF